MSYRQLLGDLDDWFARGVAAAGRGCVLCARGCSACCFGPFDISPADAELVAAAVERLDQPVRSTLQTRAREQRARYVTLEPTWAAPWDVDAIGDDAFDKLSDELAATPCPALGADGACLIYDDRPATCRMTGLAMRTREGDFLENVCPILHTSAPYAALEPTTFDLAQFEERAEMHDRRASETGWVRTTVAGAISRT